MGGRRPPEIQSSLLRYRTPQISLLERPLKDDVTLGLEIIYSYQIVLLWLRITNEYVTIVNYVKIYPLGELLRWSSGSLLHRRFSAFRVTWSR
jgi:hypothetical protein